MESSTATSLTWVEVDELLRPVTVTVLSGLVSARPDAGDHDLVAAAAGAVGTTAVTSTDESTGSPLSASTVPVLEITSPSRTGVSTGSRTPMPNDWDEPAGRPVAPAAIGTL